MIEIVRDREYLEEYSYWRSFYRPGLGFLFECDQDGNLLSISDAAKEYYRKCIDGTYGEIDYGVRRVRHAWWLPAVGLCCCGAEVELDSDIKVCEKCGRKYNRSGQELVPRLKRSRDITT
jgi:hypothetical protein